MAEALCRESCGPCTTGALFPRWAGPPSRPKAPGYATVRSICQPLRSSFGTTSRLTISCGSGRSTWSALMTDTTAPTACAATIQPASARPRIHASRKITRSRSMNTPATARFIFAVSPGRATAQRKTTSTTSTWRSGRRRVTALHSPSSSGQSRSKGESFSRFRQKKISTPAIAPFLPRTPLAAFSGGVREPNCQARLHRSMGRRAIAS